MATSSDAAHRGQRCPGDTLALLPKISMTAGTVWVQIGQCAIPRTPFSTTGFIAFFPLTTSDAKTRAEVVAIYKLFFRAQPPATNHQPPFVAPWLYEPAATAQDPDEQHAGIPGGLRQQRPDPRKSLGLLPALRLGQPDRAR